MELLKELIPTATTIGMLVNPSNPIVKFYRETQQAASRALGLQLYLLEANTERELDAVFVRLIQLRADALVIGADAFMSGRRTARCAGRQLLGSDDFSLSSVRRCRRSDELRRRQHRGFSSGGRLYRPDLKGEKPADLPVQQSTKVEFAINLKTAKALGLQVPTTLLARADEVIE